MNLEVRPVQQHEYVYTLTEDDAKTLLRELQTEYRICVAHKFNPVFREFYHTLSVELENK